MDLHLRTQTHNTFSTPNDIDYVQPTLPNTHGTLRTQTLIVYAAGNNNIHKLTRTVTNYL